MNIPSTRAALAANPLRSRGDVQQLVRDLVAPLRAHFSPARASLDLGAGRAHYGDPSGGMEAFARPLWGLVPLTAGGGDFDGWSLWQAGLAAGTDPLHPEFWGEPGDYDQRSVEQAALGFGLALTPERLWTPLSPDARLRLAAWLRTIDSVQLVRSNWLFFRVLVHLGLRVVGAAPPDSAARLAEVFSIVDGMHRGGGWYNDGEGGPPWRNGRTGDYYVPMAFHVYGLIYARLAAGDDPDRAAVFRERAREFAADFQHYFAPDGSALPFGRSLTYRFAQGSFWGALAFADAEALPWPVIKGLYLRHLRWWLRQPIFSETGLLSIGYTYPNLLMAESYNAPGSPYWALKAFLPLALPASHPFWLAPEEPLPRRAAVRTIRGAQLVLATAPDTRDVTAIGPGQTVLDWPRHAPHKYSKCAYSTRFGFCVPASVPTPAEGGFDGELSLSDDGRYYRRRDFCVDAVVAEGVAYSRWSPWPDVEVRTWLLAEAQGHLRVHRIRTGRRVGALDAGFAAPWTERASLSVRSGGGFAQVETPAGVSAIRELHGGRAARAVDQGANSHLLASLSTMPVLEAELPAGEHWLASWIVGAAVSAGEASSPDWTFVVDPSTHRIVIRRGGAVWWSCDMDGGTGESSQERHDALNAVA